MRPILKSQSAPTIFIEHGKAKQFLIAKLGEYCSYCERPLGVADLEVEHILYKDNYSLFALDWANFLLSCKNCNTTKGIKDLRIIPCFLPHLHNLLCYTNIHHSVVVVKPSLSTINTQKAQNFIDLVGLDRHDTSPSDDRWYKRMTTFDTAIDERDEYIRNPSTRNIDIIVKLAKARGFFSVWYFIFVDFPAIRAALMQAFIGTDNSCFDTSNGYEPLPRFLNDGGLLLAQ